MGNPFFGAEIVDCARNCAHLGFEVGYRQTTPEMLAQAILKNIDRKMEDKSIPFDNAKKAAEIINEHLSRNQ